MTKQELRDFLIDFGEDAIATDGGTEFWITTLESQGITGDRAIQAAEILGKFTHDERERRYGAIAEAVDSAIGKLKIVMDCV